MSDSEVTLVEMLVALALFALVGLASFSMLDAVIRTRDRTEGRLDAVAALDRALALVGRDLGQGDAGSHVLADGALRFSLEGTGGPAAMGYALAGVICCILIVTIPFGIASFRIAAYALWPFGRTVVRDPDAGVFSLLGNIIWCVVAGIWLAIGHVVTSIPLFISIIGIPMGVANIKLIPVSLLPLGARIVDND